MALYNFELSADDVKRNNELLSKTKKYNKVILGGLVLAAKTVSPRQPKFELKNRSFLSKADLGFPTRKSVTYKTEPDGSKTRTTVEETIREDGKKETITTTLTVPYERVLSESSSVSLPIAQGSNFDMELDYEKIAAKKTLRSTVTINNNKEYITEYTLDQGRDDNKRYIHEKKYVNQQKPVPPAKPVTKTSITGEIYDQFFYPAPAQGHDQTYWNDAMFNTETETEEEVIDNGDDTETTITTVRTVDPDGNFTEEVTTRTELKSTSTNRAVETYSEKNGAEEKTVTKVFNADGQLIKTTTVDKKPYAYEGGTVSIQLEEFTEEVTDYLGKVVRITRTTKRNLITGEENVEEFEEIVNPGQDLITYNRNINRDLVTGEETVEETVNTTDGYGKQTTETRSTKRNIAGFMSITEEVADQDLDDDVVDDLISGFIVNEYTFSGELMSITQAFKIMNKHQQHQLAWGLMNIREEQLNLGERLSLKKRRQLYREYLSLLNGEPNETIKGGPVLDRIELYAFGEKSVPVVFAPSADAFRYEHIEGTFGLVSWSMTLQSYTPVVRNKSTQFRADHDGGTYGRIDNAHWIGGALTSDLKDENAKFIDVSEGGLWQYD